MDREENATDEDLAVVSDSDKENENLEEIVNKCSLCEKTFHGIGHNRTNFERHLESCKAKGKKTYK